MLVNFFNKNRSKDILGRYSHLGNMKEELDNTKDINQDINLNLNIDIIILEL